MLAGKFGDGGGVERADQAVADLARFLDLLAVLGPLGLLPQEDFLEEVLRPDFLRREALPWPAAFLAGRAFVRYRKLGGERTSILPDFYIGAHAAVAGYTLLTRDPRRYRYYFPRLRVVSP